MENFLRSYTLEDKDKSMCDDVVNWFELNNIHTAPGYILEDGELRIDAKQKESKDMVLNIQQAYTINKLIRPLNFLWGSICSYIEDFQELQTMNFAIVPEFNIQKYTPPTGGFKTWHCERNSVKVNNRILVWMMYLNTIEDGGGTEFKYLNHTEKAEKGKVLIWPTDFTHTHRGVVAPSEEKYIMTGWYQLIPPVNQYPNKENT
jgi:prolyl 4-hydroxylase